jgi:threonine synthase
MGRLSRWVTELIYLVELECSKCCKTFDPGKVQTVCDRCGKPLLARYDLDAVGEIIDRIPLDVPSML